MRFLSAFLFFLILSCLNPGFILSKPGQAQWVQYYREAVKYSRAKQYNRELEYLLKAYRMKPDHKYITARLGQNFFYRQDDPGKAVYYFRISYRHGLTHRTYIRQMIRALLLQGFQEWIDGNPDQSVRSLKEAKELNAKYKINLAYMPYIADILIRRKRMPRIKPEYVHKVHLVLFNTTDAAVTEPKAARIKAELTPAQKQRAVLIMKTVPFFWEVMSGGRLSMSVKVTEWKKPLRVLKHEKIKYRKGATTYIPDYRQLTKEMPDFFRSTIKSTDSYIFVWNSKSFNMANGRSVYFTLHPGTEVYRRGFVNLPAIRMRPVINFYHEFFHILESLSGLRPIHGFRSPLREKHFPEWTGIHELEYHEWQFRRFFARLKKGWKTFSYILRDRE